MSEGHVDAPDRWYDPNDPKELQSFDERLWALTAAGRAYHVETAGVPGGFRSGVVDSGIRLSHPRMWELLRPWDLPRVRLQLVPENDGATVVVGVVDGDGSIEEVSRMPATEFLTLPPAPVE